MIGTAWAEYRRPNGAVYLAPPHPESGNIVEHLRALRDVQSRDVTAGAFPLLIGAPGLGKTAALEAAFPDVHEMVARADMRASDLLYTVTVSETGGITYTPSPFIAAAQSGGVLFVDEVSKMPEVTAVPLWPALDGRGFIPAGTPTGEDVQVDPGFFFAAATNPDTPIHPATLSRVTEVRLATSPELLERLGFDSRLIALFIAIGERNQGPQVTPVWQPQVRELQRADAFIRAGMLTTAAESLTGARVPPRDREVIGELVSLYLGVAAS